MKLPPSIRAEVRARVHALADQASWLALGVVDKSRHYEAWTDSPDIGGVLIRFLGSRDRVRVFLKDSLLKEYAQERTGDADRPLRVLGIAEGADSSHAFEKPHGRLLADGRVVCWGRADDWKLILMAMHERTHGHPARKPFGAVFLNATGRYQQPVQRELIQAAARKLGVAHVSWLEA